MLSLTAALALAVSGAPPGGGQLTSLVVKNVEVGGDQALATTLSEYILTEFQAANRYHVIGGSDLAAMLENEVQKQLVGCDEQDCLAQIAGALDAEFIASSSVGKVGDAYLVSIKIIAVREVKVVARASVKATGDDEALMAATRTAVRMVTATSGFGDTLPSVTALPLSLWGGAVVALATGVFFGIKAQSHYRDFQDPTYADVDGAASDGKSSQLIANVAYGAAALSAGAGVLAWWLGGQRVELVPEEVAGAAVASTGERAAR